MSQESYDAIVIGSGFGGLALAIRLQASGKRTLILEKRDKPGGRAYVYEDQGFVFDAGPTVVTDPTCLQELFTLSGRNMEDYVELLPVSPFYRLLWEDGFQFDYVNDQARLEAQIAAHAPDDVQGYRDFLNYSEAVFKEGYLKLGHVPFPDFRSMIRVAPQLMKLESYRSVYAIVSRFVRDPQLRQALSFHTLLVGGNPFDTSAIYALIHALERRWGVWFPRGGTGALVRGLARLFTDMGGTLLCNEPAAEILTTGHAVRGVRSENGGTFLAPIVCSNADVVHTYGQLLGRTAPGRKEAARLSKKRFSMSLFVVYFGLRRKPENLEHHTVLFGPRYKELLAEIFRGDDLPEDFSLYLHSPSVTDPSLAPEGCSTHYVLSPVPHLGNAPLDWATLGPIYRDKLLASLEERVIPNLRADLVTSRIFTPADFQSELNAHHGSAFSLEPLLWQSAYFRPHNRDRSLQGLYLVGAGTHPGAGIPGVVGSAKATAGVILSTGEGVNAA